MSGGICIILPTAAQIPDLTGTYATANNSPSDPPGTTSATYVMMGFGSTATITPKKSGKIVVMVSLLLRSGAVGNIPQGILKYGIGTAPVNGAAVTGTSIGVLKRQSTNIDDVVGGVFLGIVSGLDKTGTVAVWIDIGLLSSNGSTSSIQSTDIVVVELP